LHDRIYNFLEEKEFFYEGQSGFMKGRKTVDNIFMFKNVIDCHLAKSQKLYSVYVDFTHAFDTVNR
jgi:hypothetical protein